MITFKVAQIRELLKMVHKGQISFTRFVEILDEHANSENNKNLFSKDQLKTALFKKYKYLSDHPEDQKEFNYCNATLSDLNKLAELDAESIIRLINDGNRKLS